MSQEQRVFITGRSALSSVGLTADANWNALLAGETGIEEIKNWDISSWTHRLGGELKAFQPATLLPDRKLIKVISRQDVLGINVAMQAIEHSQLLAYRDTLDSAEDFNQQTAIYVGSPGNKYYQQYDFLPLLAKTGENMQAFADGLFSEVHPMWLLRILPNNVLAYTGITYGFKGANHNITNHVVGGMQAIIEAWHAIKQGQIDRAVVVAYDVGPEPQALFYYEKLGIISARHLKPFDAEHDGTILAEGAAALVLESEASIAARGGVCYGEVVAGMSGTESAGLFSIDEQGAPLANLITQTLAKSEISSTDIGCVVAHGNGSIKSDVSEARAIQAAFGTYQVPVTATKWSMGHTLCASGVLDTVLATYALAEQCVPGVAPLGSMSQDCANLNISNQSRQLSAEKRQILLINRGFASMNATLVLKSCD